MTDPDRDFKWLDSNTHDRDNRLFPRNHYRIEKARCGTGGASRRGADPDDRRNTWRLFWIEEMRYVFEDADRRVVEKEFSRLTGEAWTGTGRKRA